jgi:D-glycero-alpha-D-manno-heptose-7-phosphate kinase
VEATAPTRIDLAGGTLDIWPLYLFHPGAVTVNVAVDRRAWCRVETGISGVSIESKDTLQKVEAPDVGAILAQGTLALVAHVLRALEIESGVRVSTQSRVPAGSGLGGSSALAVVVAAAAARAVGRELEPSGLWRLTRDAEAQAIGVPTGVQDYIAAIHGGVMEIALLPGGIRTERLATDPARVEESLVLVNAGVTRFSGINNWEVFRSQIDGDDGVRDCLHRICGAAGRLRDALRAGRFDEVGRLMEDEWEARKGLAPGVSSPEIERIVELARSHGGAGKACGAGGGGMVALWVPPEEREKVEAGLRAGGFHTVPVRLDLRGLEVECSEGK